MGILSTYADSVTLVNRTSRVLSGRYDGEDIAIQPGDNPGFPKVAVQYIKNQNILKGSKHPSDPRKYICLVGVKGSKDDCTVIPDAVLAEADERFEAVDRKGEFWGEPMREVKLMKKSAYSSYDAAVEIPGDMGGDKYNVAIE